MSKYPPPTRSGGTFNPVNYGTTLLTTTAYLSSIRGTQSATSGQSIGPTTILNTQNNLWDTAVGTFQKFWGWDTASASHTIAYSNLVFNSGNDNLAGTLKIFVSNKANTNPKAGVMTVDIVKCLNAFTTVASPPNSITKNTNLTTFAITNSGNNLVVSTDADCRICWSFTACV